MNPVQNTPSEVSSTENVRPVAISVMIFFSMPLRICFGLCAAQASVAACSDMLQSLHLLGKHAVVAETALRALAPRCKQEQLSNLCRQTLRTEDLSARVQREHVVRERGDLTDGVVQHRHGRWQPVCARSRFSATSGEKHTPFVALVAVTKAAELAATPELDPCESATQQGMLRDSPAVESSTLDFLVALLVRLQAPELARSLRQLQKAEHRR